jgi:hypothetical protein
MDITIDVFLFYIFSYEEDYGQGKLSPVLIPKGDGAWMDVVPNEFRLAGAENFAIIAVD